MPSAIHHQHPSRATGQETTSTPAVSLQESSVLPSQRQRSAGQGDLSFIAPPPKKKQNTFTNGRVSYTLFTPPTKAPNNAASPLFKAASAFAAAYTIKSRSLMCKTRSFTNTTRRDDTTKNISDQHRKPERGEDTIRKPGCNTINCREKVAAQAASIRTSRSDTTSTGQG